MSCISHYLYNNFKSLRLYIYQDYFFIIIYAIKLGWSLIYKMTKLLVYNYKSIRRDLNLNKIKLKKVISQQIKY